MASRALERPRIETAALLICTRGRPEQLAACLHACKSIQHRLCDGRQLRLVVCVADNNDRPQLDWIRRQAIDAPVRLLTTHEPQRGYAAVRNAALGLAVSANADIAVFIDDDSTPDPRLIIEHVAAMERYQADAVLGRIEGLSQRPREGRRVYKAGTGNVSMRRWVFDPVDGLGLRFDPRLNLLGYEDFEFFGELIRNGGVIYQSTRPVVISAPYDDAAPNSAQRAYQKRYAFAVMEGRNEITVVRMRHGRGAATARLLRRYGPIMVRGALALLATPLIGLIAPARRRSHAEHARIRLAKAGAAVGGLWRPGYDRPMARLGDLREIP